MKKILKSLVLLIIIFNLCTYHITVIATSVNDLQDEQNNLKDEQDNVKDEISSKREELNKVKQEKNETLNQVENLISKISSYKNEINELNSKISTLEEKINNAKSQIKEDEEEYARKQDTLNERLVTMYKTGETSYLDFMLSSSSLVDFISSYYLISEVASYDTQMLEDLEEHKQKIEAEKEELEENKRELSSSKVTLESKKQALQVAKKTKEQYAEKLDGDQKKIQAKLQELQDTNDELDKQIKAAKEAIRKAKEEAERRAREEAARRAREANRNNNADTYSPSTTPSSSGFIRPVSSQFEIGTKMYYSSGAYHGALDFRGSGIYGAPIYAVADGYVVTSTAVVNSSGKYISYGNYVLIAHYNGLYTLYAHMSSRAVTAGTTVKQGQVIGYVGSTGNSTGPHLHFEVRTGNGTYSERVNPLNYLP